VKLVWAAFAKRDLGEIITYIWFDNPAAAKRVRQRIEKTVGYLKSQPFMGRMGEAFVPPSYRIVYEMTGETVSILRVVHTSRQCPPLEGGDV
jgi:plasmid stabilization system protein ParE